MVEIGKNAADCLSSEREGGPWPWQRFFFLYTGSRIDFRLLFFVGYLPDDPPDQGKPYVRVLRHRP